jgi:hypothetical protein
MNRGSKNRGSGEHPGQLVIEWSGATTETPTVSPVSTPADELDHLANVVAASPNKPSQLAGEPLRLVQRLPWDFRTSFPQPTIEALDAGIISEEDMEPENVKVIHDEHAREALTALKDLDTVLDARRRGVDPRNNKKPMLQPAREWLQKFFETEPGRLERWFQNLMDTYDTVFGPEATDAFGKAIRAWHAGIEVVVEKSAEKSPAVPPMTIRPRSIGQPPMEPNTNGSTNGNGVHNPTMNGHAVAIPDPLPSAALQILRQPREQKRVVAVLPVPKPLHSAVAAGHFGQDEHGRNISPGAREVRAITNQHAEKLIDLLDTIRQASHSCNPSDTNRLQGMFQSALAVYAEDFGDHAAKQLEAYTLRQAHVRSSPNGRGWRR